MEAFLLTLDVVCMVLLCLGVIRVSRSGDPQHLGILGYSEVRVRKPTNANTKNKGPYA